MIICTPLIINPANIIVNPTKIIINPVQINVNPAKMIVNPEKIIVNPAQKINNPAQIIVNLLGKQCDLSCVMASPVKKHMLTHSGVKLFNRPQCISF